MSIFKKAFIGGCLAGALATTEAQAFLNSEEAWNSLLQFGVRQINAPGEFEIELGRLTQPGDGLARVDFIRLKDGDGVWLTMDGVVVDWNAGSLLDAEFVFEQLSAERIEMLRSPISRGDPPDPNPGPIEFVWPRPPVPLAVKELRIDVLSLSDEVLPQPLEAEVRGAFSDIGDVQRAELSVNRLSAPGGGFEIDARINFETQHAAIAIQAEEGPGGLVAAFTGLPEDQPVAMSFEAGGFGSNLPYVIDATIGDLGAATGDGFIDWSGDLAMQFFGEVSPGPDASDNLRAALGEAASLELDLFQQPTGEIRLSALEIESPLLRLSGLGSIDQLNDRLDMNLTWRVLDPAVFSRLIAPTSFEGATGSLRASGKLSAPDIVLGADLVEVRGAFGTASGATLALESAPLSSAPDAPQDVSLELVLANLALVNDDLQALLGDEPRFTAKGRYDPAAQVADLQSLTIAADGFLANGDARYRLDAGRFDADLSGTARDLGPIARLAGLDFAGAAGFDLSVRDASFEAARRIEFDLSAESLTTSDPTAQAALGDSASLSVVLVETEPGVMSLETGRLQSKVLQATAEGEFSLPNDALDLSLEWRAIDAAALSALVEGASFQAAEGFASLFGSVSEPQIEAQIALQGLETDVIGAEAAYVNLEASSRKDRRQPFSLTASLEGAQTSDPALAPVLGDNPFFELTGLYDTATGLLSLEDSAVGAAIGRIALTGDINLRRSTLGLTLTAGAADLSVLSDLAGAPTAGQASLTAELAGPFAAPSFSYYAAVEDARYGEFSADLAQLSGDVEPEDGETVFTLSAGLDQPDLNDPGINDLIGEAPSFDLTGRFNPETQQAALSEAILATDSVEIAAAGGVDLAAQTMQFTVDVDTAELATFGALAGLPLSGEITQAQLTVSGPFTAPRATLRGRAAPLAFGAYSARSAALDISVDPGGEAIAFDVGIEAEGVATGDPVLDALAEGGRINAQGDYTVAAQALRLSAFSVRSELAEITGRGTVDLAAGRLEVSADLAEVDLDRAATLTGAPVSGRIKRMRVTAEGPLTAPTLTLSGGAAPFGLNAYRFERLEFDAEVAPQNNALDRLAFTLAVSGQGARTGDARLNALAEDSILRVSGLYETAAQRLSLAEAMLESPFGDFRGAGFIDLAGQRLRLEAEAAIADLSEAAALAGLPLSGTVQALNLRAEGSFDAPEISVTAQAAPLAYGDMGADQAQLSFSLTPPASRSGPMDIALSMQANGVDTGDPRFDALVDGATLSAEGAYDPAESLLMLESFGLRAPFGALQGQGVVDLAAQSLRLSSEARIDDLSPLSRLIGAPVAGALPRLSLEADGPFAAPRIRLEGRGEGLSYDAYSAETADLAFSLDPGAFGELAFDLDLQAEGVATGDPRLDALADRTTLVAQGAFDPEAGRLRLSRFSAETPLGSASGSGVVDAAAQRLDVTAEAEIASLAPLSGLIDAPISGALPRVTLRAQGPFAAPEISLAAEGRALRYETYAADTASVAFTLAPQEAGDLLFDLQAEAEGVATGDPRLDALADRASVVAQGAVEPEAGRLRLSRFNADTPFGAASGSGFVDMAAERLDVTAEAQINALEPLSGLIGAPISGSLPQAILRARGPFAAPEITLIAEGRDLVYEAYGADAVTVNFTLLPDDSGELAFDLEAQAEGASTGDPRLDALADRASVIAEGAFDPEAGRLWLSSFSADTPFGAASGSGFVDMAAERLDVTAEARINALEPLSSLIGAPISGALPQATLRAKGPFAAPEISLVAQGRNLAYAAYGADSVDLVFTLLPDESGALAFDLNAEAEGVSTGDPRLDALADQARIIAEGEYDPAAGRLRLSRFNAAAPFGSASGSGVVDLAAERLDVTAEAQIASLGPLSGLIGAPVSGALPRAVLHARGPFTAPEVSLTAEGRGLAYGAYGADAVTLAFTLAPDPSGDLVFDLQAEAEGVATGDPRLDALAEGASITAAGDYDPAAQRLRLSRLSAAAPFGSVSGAGLVDLAAERLDLAAEAQIASFAPLSGLIGAPVSGAAPRLAITAEGPFAAPRLSVEGRLKRFAYAAYELRAADISLEAAPRADGSLAFDAAVDARGASLGDPALDALAGDVAVAAQGAFDPNAQLLTLDDLAARGPFGRLEGAGTVDLAAQRLNVALQAEIDDLSRFQYLAGAPLSGSVSGLRLKAEGPFDAPRLTASGSAANLRYDAYGVAAADFEITAGPGGEPASFDILNFDARLNARGLSTGDPALDALAGDAAVSARGAYDVGRQRLTLDRLQATAPFGALDANGLVDLGARRLQIGFNARIDDLSRASALAGDSLAGRLTARGSVVGSFDLPRIDAQLEGAGLRYGQYAAAGAQISIATRPQGAQAPFSITAALQGVDIGDPTLNVLIGDASLSAEGIYDSATQRLTLNPAQLSVAAGRLQTAGVIDLGAQALDVSYAVALDDLSRLTGLAGVGLGGAARLEGRLYGPLADPAARGSLAASGLSVEGQSFGSLSAQYDLAALVSGPRGAVSAQGDTPYGPISLSTEFSLAGGGLAVEGLNFQGLGVTLSGSATAPSGAPPLSGQFDLTASRLNALGAFVGLELSGAVSAQVTLTPRGGAQDLTFRVTGGGLRAAQPGGGEIFRAANLSAAGQVGDVLGRDPTLAVQASTAGASASGFRILQAAARLDGPLSRLRVSLSGLGGDGSARFSAIASARLAGGPLRASVEQVSFVSSGATVSLAAPMVIEQGFGGGWTVRGLDLRANEGRLFGEADWSPLGARINLDIESLPLTLARELGLDLFATGHLTGRVALDAGAQRSGDISVIVTDLRMKGATAAAPLMLRATGQWRGSALTLEAEATSDNFITPIRAEARIPLLTAGGSPLPAPDMNAPFSAAMSWQGDMSEIWPLVPAPGHLLGGRTQLTARASGTLTSPAYDGSLTITQGYYQNLDLSILFYDLEARAGFSSAQRLTFSVTATDGRNGRLSASGSYAVASGAVDATAEAQRMTLMRRDDLTAIISGVIAARTTGDELSITGQLRNDFTEFRLIGAFAPNLVVIEAEPVGITAPPYTPTPPSPPGPRITFNIVLDIPDEFFVRGRGLESEWGGNLRVAGDVDDPQIYGSILRRRGWLDLIGRQFDLEVGEVRFNGDPLPTLNVRLQADNNGIIGWVDVTGPADDPEISFGSNPSLPEDEVLPRLLFGRDKQSLSGIEAAQLAAGVATLLSGKPGVMDFVRGAAGLDTLRVESSDSGAPTISGGRYVADGVFVGARQNLETNETSAIVEIDVFNNITIDAELGATESEAGINWSMDY